MTIFLVRPHPPAAILNRACPIPEDYKYNWQPMALKYIAYRLDETFGAKLDIRIWHLMDPEDDESFRAALISQQPALVVFSEIDILVGEVSRLATVVRKTVPGAWTAVGGKQSSLLREGDLSPFEAVDYVLRGDSIGSLTRIVSARLEGKRPEDCPALVRLDAQGSVTGPLTYDKRNDITELDGIRLQDFGAENHPMEEYLVGHQLQPALIQGPTRTASVFAGSGCPHRCVFCQSPVEYGDESCLVKTRDPSGLAEEIAWLVNKYQVNNIFSLEANLCFENWLSTYECLERSGIDQLAISGFVRAADVVSAGRTGLLIKLARKGMRVLSVGLDVPPHSAEDVYRKDFTGETLEACLAVCEETGILLLATFVGDPTNTREEFMRQLRYLEGLPVAAVDVRLAIALRGTDYFRQVSPWLIYRPEAGRRYFNRQNYRYQTVRIPGKITPRQTYQAVRDFRREFLTSDRHLDYVLRFAGRFPEAIPFFQGQYKPVVENRHELSEKLGELAGILGL
jgi:radical SAM superfamily enzyme YgiQ (UPF0313 family)